MYSIATEPSRNCFGNARHAATLVKQGACQVADPLSQGTASVGIRLPVSEERCGVVLKIRGRDLPRQHNRASLWRSDIRRGASASNPTWQVVERRLQPRSA